MDKAEIFATIVRLLERTVRIDCGHVRHDDTPFKSYGIDSLNLMRWINAIEDEFGISIRDIEVFAAFSFQRLVDVVHRKTHDERG